jgi:hypothetical protein
VTSVNSKGAGNRSCLSQGARPHREWPPPVGYRQQCGGTVEQLNEGEGGEAQRSK